MERTFMQNGLWRGKWKYSYFFLSLGLPEQARIVTAVLRDQIGYIGILSVHWINLLVWWYAAVLVSFQWCPKSPVSPAVSLGWWKTGPTSPLPVTQPVLVRSHWRTFGPGTALTCLHRHTTLWQWRLTSTVMCPTVVGFLLMERWRTQEWVWSIFLQVKWPLISKISESNYLASLFWSREGNGLFWRTTFMAY